MSRGNEFAIAEGKRIEITEQQARQIREMYKGIEKEFGEKIRILSNKTNISSIMREQYLKEFTQDLQNRIEILNFQLEKTITNNALEVATAVTNDNEAMLRDMGFGGVFTSNFYIPQDAVNSIVTGQLYEGKWSLSSAIWSDNQKKINDINSIVGKGLAENKTTYEIARDLERYVNPEARKEWSWAKVYPGTSKKIDYNAQRLARTMISHAYQESFVLNTKDNPFIEAYQWEASNTDRTCATCAERDGRIYAKDELPLDHPNGMCTFTIVREKSYEEIASDLSNWVKGTGDSELNEKLDNYADKLGYNVKEWTAGTQPVQNAGKEKSEEIKIFNRYTGDDKKEVNALYADQVNKYSSNEKSAIRRYVGNSKSTQYEYEKINGYLRNGGTISKANEEAIIGIDSAIRNFEVKEAFVARRGVDFDAFNELLPGINENTPFDKIKEALIGAEFVDKGYMSASWDTWGGFYRDVFIEINVPEGKGYGCMVGDLSNHKDENEFILKRDTHVEIYDVTKDKRDRTIIHSRIVED